MFNKKIIILFGLILLIGFISALPQDEGSPINHKLNYTEIISEISSNNSIYWNGNAWSDTRWLNIDGGNANQDIDISAYDFTGTNLIATNDVQTDEIRDSTGAESFLSMNIGSNEMGFHQDLFAMGSASLECGAITASSFYDRQLTIYGGDITDALSIAVGTLDLRNNDITDSTGIINFDDENITSQGLGTIKTINTTKLYNTEGDLKIQPDAQGSVYLFDETDVANNVDGKHFRINRKAAEGDSSFGFYVDQYKIGYMTATTELSVQSGYNYNMRLIPGGNGKLRLSYTAGGDITMFDGASSGENPSLKQSGYITNGANEVDIEWVVEDGDDMFHLKRENTNVLGFNIEMPVDVDGNITSDNVFIPQYIFSHTNATISVLGAGTWTNITFDQEVADINQGVSHDSTGSNNMTFTIMDAGIYEVDYDLDIEDTSVGASTVNVAGRLIYHNSTEVIGSVFETDITKNGAGTELSHDFLIEAQAGDSFIFQFIGSDADVVISTHGTYGDYPESATVVIKKVANL